ncbi:porin [Candidatus Reidiella endopervernicosa]|uniref:Porin n=1 Tax=Candidatus Reidiella endopervernicosa TaxID=2738883 RepID=A0A6N0HRN4_9GAMM|nr:porin [Candidatus Reidiella endopervernicosa]QKQ24985.1 porin [Candidatus Reidiella endopervernicosa]
MNRKLLSLLVASLVSAPAITSADVSISGTMHMSIDSTDDGGTSDSDNSSVSSNFSNIVFSGDEDLGSGMKAVWQVTSVTTLDEQSGDTWATGPSYLGLSGNFGTVIAGKADTPYFTFQSKFDVMDGTLADLATIMGTDAEGNELFEDDYADNFNLTTPNTIAYISPNMGGFTVVGAYVTDWAAAGDEDSNNFDAFSVSGTYENGGLMIGAAFERHNHDPSGCQLYDDWPGAFDADVWCDDATTNDALEIGAAFTTGDTSVGLLWENIDGTGAIDRDAWAAYLTQGFGNNTFKVLYSTVSQSSLPDNGEEDEDEASMWAIGLDHAMSPRTTIYGMYASLENDDDSERYLGGVDHGDRLGDGGGRDQSGFSLGIVHSF